MTRADQDPSHTPAAPAAWPGLDGLRGLGLVAVVGFHSGRALFRGGPIGLDLFFVLSGFLVSDILLRHWNAHGRGMLVFYWRRLARIGPALWMFLAVSTLLAVAMKHPFLPRSLVLSGAAWTSVFSSDILVDYFPRSFPGTFFHTWSIGVEVHFYLLWPLVLARASRYGSNPRRGIRVTLTLIVLACLVRLICFLTWGFHIFETFSLQGRADLLLLGGLLALDRSVRPHSYQRFFGPTGRVARGLTLLSLSFVVLQIAISEPYWWSIFFGYTLNGIAAATLIAGCIFSPQLPASRALGFAPLAWLGRISYSVYLWHWLVNGLFPRHLGPLPQVAVICLHYGTTMTVACASYYFVERPLRQRMNAAYPRRTRSRAGKAGVSAEV